MANFPCQYFGFFFDRSFIYNFTKESSRQIKKLESQEICKDRKFGKDLIFISRISRDGSGTVKCEMENLNNNNTQFKMTCLSLSQETYIASEFNSYIVKIKK